MNKHHSYKNIIESKLSQLPAADADLLWNNMHSILDKEMPQKKERRRFIAWFLNGKGLFLLTFSSLFLTSSSLFLLSTKENFAVAGEKTPASPQTGKLLEKEAAKVLQTKEYNLNTANKPERSTNKSVFPEISSTSSVDYVIDDNSTTRKTKGRQMPADIIESYPSSNFVSNTRENSEVDLAKLDPVHQALHISPNQNKHRFSLTQPIGINKKMNNRRNNESGFYAGIMFGADMSSVHFQSAKGGSTAGFIVGYSLDQKWSIESGLLWDTKRVYDDGTFFNPPGYTATNGVRIVAVNGKSRLHEWPINVKYTIRSGDHSFFATSGLSSYFMKLENYDYEYTQNNQPGGHNYLSYKNETKDWFGVVNFSVGYSHKIGNNGSIRVEPYLKVPISNIGIGNMPIMSMGLNVGITKPLKR